jgi:hypothetical protein
MASDDVPLLRAVHRPTLQDVANTVHDHIERCREEIATAERMLEDLRRQHGIGPDNS